MKIKLLKPVLILLTVLSVQIAWAQPNCIPTGSNSSATQLTYCMIGDDYDFTIDNNSRHNNLSKEISLDQQDYDLQFVFNNPAAEMLYLGIYLDLNDDGNYDYPSEMVFEGQSNGTNYSEVLTLTEAVLDQLGQGPKWMRMIVSGDQSSIYNTCEYPNLLTPYQAVDSRSGRIKIRKSTARHDPGNGFGPVCIASDDHMESRVFVKNNYELDIAIYNVKFWYGHENSYCSSGELLEYDLPGPGQILYDYTKSCYYWDIPEGFDVEAGEEIEFYNLIANQCWFPINNFELEVKVTYDFPTVPSQMRSKREAFDFEDVQICEEPIIWGGGGFTSGSSSQLDFRPTISPNPSSGNTTVNFELSTESDVNVEVYNLLGERVLSENANGYSAGQHRLSLATENLPVGTYLINVKINGASNMLTKMIIAR